MRNEFGGQCYRCGEYVNPGDGHFERKRGRWRVQHANCAIHHRGSDVVHESDVRAGTRKTFKTDFSAIAE